MHPKKFMFSNTEDHGKLYLYKYGDECVRITGGYEVTYESYCTITKESDHLRWTLSSGSGLMQQATVTTINKLRFDGTYKDLHIAQLNNMSTSNVNYTRFELSDYRTERAYNNNETYILGETNTNVLGGKNVLHPDLNITGYFRDNTNYCSHLTNKVYDISNIGGEWYFVIYHYVDYYQSGNMNVYAVWLEK